MHPTIHYPPFSELSMSLLLDCEPGTTFAVVNIPREFCMEAQYVLPHPRGVVFYHQGHLIAPHRSQTKGVSIYACRNSFEGYALHSQGLVIQDGTAQIFVDDHGGTSSAIPPFDPETAWNFQAEKSAEKWVVNGHIIPLAGVRWIKEHHFGVMYLLNSGGFRIRKESDFVSSSC